MTDPHATAADAGALADLSMPRKVHIVGIGGAAMSAIAIVLAGTGHEVSGSDQRGSDTIERLGRAGISVAIGHDPSNVPAGVEVVAVSTAIPEDNVELAEAHRRGLAVCSREAMMVAILEGRSVVAVAGTHGKTTTSAMLAMVLRDAGLDPSFIIGGDLKEVGSGAALGSGDLFVVEADESDSSFLGLPRQVAIVTNVEPDHIEHYGGMDCLEEAFEHFLEGAAGMRLVCADDPRAALLGERAGAITYGTAASAEYRLVDVVSTRERVTFGIDHGGRRIAEAAVPMAGIHNARNACAALVAGIGLGASVEQACESLARFSGVARRFEHRGEMGGVCFIDDYAHLPAEVSAMVSAALDCKWRRIVCIFQPHRYSRTATLWTEFGDAFAGVDQLVVTGIYPAGEQPRAGVSAKLIVDAVLDRHPRQQVAYLPDRADLGPYVTGVLRPGDLCLTLGAGDLTTLPDELMRSLSGGRTRTQQP